ARFRTPGERHSSPRQRFLYRYDERLLVDGRRRLYRIRRRYGCRRHGNPPARRSRRTHRSVRDGVPASGRTNSIFPMIFLLAAILLTSGQIGVRNDLNEQMPQPLPPSAEYMPTLSYPLARNLPATVWSTGSLEALYQPILGNPLITGQLWLTDKTVVMQCGNVPKF